MEPVKIPLMIKEYYDNPMKRQYLYRISYLDREYTQINRFPYFLMMPTFISRPRNMRV